MGHQPATKRKDIHLQEPVTCSYKTKFFGIADRQAEQEDPSALVIFLWAAVCCVTKDEGGDIPASLIREYKLLRRSLH